MGRARIAKNHPSDADFGEEAEVKEVQADDGCNSDHEKAVIGGDGSERSGRMISGQHRYDEGRR